MSASPEAGSNYAAWKGAVRRVSETVSQDFPNVDTEDVFCAVCEKLITVGMPPSLAPYDPGAREYIRELCEKAAWNIRKEQLSFTSQYYYREPDVAEIMETVFDRTDWPSGFTPTDARSGERDRLASLEVRMDACYGYRALPESLREALITRYYDKVMPELEGEKRMLSYAITALTRNMNDLLEAGAI